jgi:hypothetical protein
MRGVASGGADASSGLMWFGFWVQVGIMDIASIMAGTATIDADG